MTAREWACEMCEKVIPGDSPCDRRGELFCSSRDLFLPTLEAAVAAARGDEREECAKVADAQAACWTPPDEEDAGCEHIVSRAIASAIRARSAPKGGARG